MAMVLVVVAAVTVAVAAMVPGAAAVAAAAALMRQLAAWQQQRGLHAPALLVLKLLWCFKVLLNRQQIPIVAACWAARDAAGLQVAVGLQLWVGAARR